MLKICIEIHNTHNYMTLKELTSLSHQIKMSYADNQKRKHKATLIIANYHQIKENLIQNHINWQVHFINDYIIDHLHKNKTLNIVEQLNAKNINDHCIYLSSDANEELVDLCINKIYIVGGIVDRNRHKNYVYGIGKEKNVRCCRLPIDRYVKMNCVAVLTTNQVFSILMDFYEGRDWKEAFVNNIPKRKIIKYLM